MVGRLELLGRGSKWDVGCMGVAAAAGTLGHVLPRHLLGWEGKAGGERARIQLGVQRGRALGLWSKAEFQVKGPEL